MIIQCDQCSARFRLDDAKVTASGVRVRCKRCQHIFQVTRDVPSEEPDLDALLMGLRVGTTQEKIPPQGQGEVSAPSAADVPMSAPGEPHPSGYAVPFSPADREPAPDFPRETTAAEQTPEEFSFSFEPSATEHEPPAATPLDDFSRASGAEMPDNKASGAVRFDADTTTTSSVTVAPEDTMPSAPQADDVSGFTFSEEPPAATTATPFAREPVDELPRREEPGWDGFELEATVSFPFSEETVEVADKTGSPDVPVPETVTPVDSLHPVAPDSFEGFEIELPEPGGPPPEPVSGQQDVAGDPDRKPIPVQTREPVEETPFDFSGWTPESPEGSEKIASSPHESLAGTPDVASTSPVTERLSFGFSTGPDETPPVVPESPSFAGEEPQPAATPPASSLGYPDVDTSSFSDEEPPFPVTSRRQGPSVLAILGMAIIALVVVAVGGVGALYVIKGPEGLDKVGLGSVGRLLGAGHKTSERILIRTVQGSYLTNSQAGELFVIRGEALNTYKTPRAAIQVRGLIYNAAGAVILQKSTFCGNSLTPEQLTALPLTKIEEAMNNRLGESLSNIGVPSGSAVPFVIVFSGLPKEAADYGVEIAGSQSAGQ